MKALASLPVAAKLSLSAFFIVKCKNFINKRAHLPVVNRLHQSIAHINLVGLDNFSNVEAKQVEENRVLDSV